MGGSTKAKREIKKKRAGVFFLEFISMDFLRTLEPVRLKEAVTEFLLRAGRFSPTAFPFGNPISMEACHVPVVKSTGYWATCKTDGTRVCLIFCTWSASGRKIAVLMDRTGNLYGLKVSCEPQLFEGSLFDAELVYCPATDAFTIQVFDIAMLEGESLHREPLSARLELIADVLTATACLVPRLRFEVKKMVKLIELKDLLALEDAGSGVPTDGYILTPENAQASMPGTAWSVFKIKPHHTIDLLCTASELWYGSRDEFLRMDAFPGYSVRLLDDVSKLPDGCIAEFTATMVSAAEGGGDCQLVLKIKGVREDKTTPNNALCVTRTLASIRDAVTIASLLPSPQPPVL